MKKYIITFLLIVAVAFGALLFAGAVQAQGSLADEATAQMGSFGKQSYGTEDAPWAPYVIGNIIKVVLSLLGIVMVIQVVMAGVTYMTASGEPAKIDKAKKRIIYNIIGLLIALCAFVITSYIVGLLVDTTYVQ